MIIFPTLKAAKCEIPIHKVPKKHHFLDEFEKRIKISSYKELNPLRTTVSTKHGQFSDVFGASNNLENITNKERTGTNKFTPSKADVSVANCLFHDCSSSSSYGGAIYCSSTIERIFIEETTFITCTTSKEKAGGIYFSNSNNGECVIFRTCSFNCSSTYSIGNSNGQCAYIETHYDDILSKNEVNESTIAGTKNENTKSYYTLFLYYSNIMCSSVNITNNECCFFTALVCVPTKANTCTSFVMYASIVNNSANNGHGCISLDNQGSTQLISTSNIINNKQSTDNSATIRTNANLFINESCIIGNNEDKYVFYEDGSSCKISITNCTLDSDIIAGRRYSGSFTIICSKEYGFINALSHIVTEKCKSSFDSYGTLTAAIQKNETSSCPMITPYCKCMKRHINSWLL